MTTRHASLIPLTHDHHHVLKQARGLRVAAEGGNAERIAAAARGFLTFYDEEMLVHFREEEEKILPLVPMGDKEVDQLLTRTLVEHLRIHALVRKLRQEVNAGQPQQATFFEISDLLRSHIRMEEDRLFPLVERTVAEADLREVHLVPRSRGR